MPNKTCKCKRTFNTALSANRKQCEICVPITDQAKQQRASEWRERFFKE